MSPPSDTAPPASSALKIAGTYTFATPACAVPSSPPLNPILKVSARTFTTYRSLCRVLLKIRTCSFSQSCPSLPSLKREGADRPAYHLPRVRCGYEPRFHLLLHWWALRELTPSQFVLAYCSSCPFEGHQSCRDHRYRYPPISHHPYHLYPASQPPSAAPRNAGNPSQIPSFLPSRHPRPPRPPRPSQSFSFLCSPLAPPPRARVAANRGCM